MVELERAREETERKGDLERLREFRERQSREESERREKERERKERSVAVSARCGGRAETSEDGS